ncbi:serine/threonine-protein kinase ATR-like isoform X2 [Montipora capricornis]|uniref:serine/threonine-protein kinase ATR-like isoform X2 n=1 Tax=Montipora capricornis TaxID=246305 RepID=UPI0035F17042
MADSGSISEKLAPIMTIMTSLIARRNPESLSTQEHHMSAKEIRKLLCEFFNSVLTDLDGVAVQLSRKTGGTPYSEMIWRFLRHCLGSFPECFVEVEPRVVQDSTCSTSHEAGHVQGNKICEPVQVFASWILSRILCVLADANCSALHDQGISAIVSLLQLVKGKDLVFYNKLLTEFVSLLEDSVTIDETLFCLTEPPADALPLYLVHFQFSNFESEELSLVKKLICIRDEVDCYSLQEAVSKIIAHVISDIHQFARSSVPGLWKTSCHLLQTGLFCIKKVALDIMTGLLPWSGLPAMPVLDVFVKCLCFLLELLVTVMEKLPENGREKVIVLEASVAKSLEVLSIHCLHRKEKKQQRALAVQHTLAYTFPPAHINLFLFTLRKILHNVGLQRYQTNVLKRALCEFLAHLYMCMPASSCRSVPITQNYITEDINQCLVDFIGNQQHQQFLVRCLCEAVLMERANKKTSVTLKTSESATCSNTGKLDGIANTANTPRKKATLIVSQSVLKQEKSLALSPIIVKVMEKIKFFGKSILLQANESCPNADEFTCHLEGVRVIIEVMVHLYSPCINNPNEVGDIQELLKSVDLNDLFNILKPSLQILTRIAKDLSHTQCILNSLFHKLVQISGALYVISDFIQIPLDFYQFLIFLVSIPWLSIFDPPWSDLPNKFGFPVDAMASTGAMLSPVVHTDSKDTCLHLLAAFPSDSAPTWRSQVFLSVLKDSSHETKILALKWLPLLLSSLGSFSYHMVTDVLPGHIAANPLVQEEIAKIIGPLACVLTDNTVITKLKSDLSFDKSVCESITVICPDCDSVAGNQKGSEHNKKPCAVVNAATFTPFLQLLAPEVVVNVKCAFIQSMKRIFTHMTFNPDSAAHSSIVSATCFDLIEDSDFHVRMCFSNVVSYIVKLGGADSSNNMQQTVISKLKKVFVEASLQRKYKLQETVVLTIGQLGRIAEGELLLVVIVSLLESLTAHSQLIRAVAFKQVQEVASFQGKPIKELFSNFKQPICKFVVDAIDKIQTENPTAEVSFDAVLEVASVFEFKDVHSFLKSTLRFLIPHLVKKSSPSSSAILRHIAKEMKMNRREMLLENFKFIFSFLVRTCSPPELEKALSYVQKETDVELGSLLRAEGQSVYNQLLLYLSVSYNKVFSGLAMLASKDDTYTGPKDLQTTQHLANFLQSRLLGILAFYNSVLLTNTDLEEKQLALESLTKLMQVMGRKFITTVRVKVMGILRLCLRFQDKGFPELSCDAWDSFVRNVELSSLGPMLSQIVVTLLPYLNKLPARVTPIFHFLIVENKAYAKDYFHEIYFLPDIPQLRRVSAVLRSSSGNASKKMGLQDQLRQSLKGVAHESTDVQKHALTKLKQLLHDNQATLHGYVLSNETVDPIIPQIISVLMSSCHKNDPESKVLVAECLGELGAVDPGRLDKLTHDPVDEQTVFESGCDDPEFAVELINLLVQAFLAAHDTRAQDCSAYAIQEVLLTYECSESKKDGVGYQLWKKFPEHIQELLRPHLYSKYLSSTTTNWSRLPKPIYKSAKGRSFNEWVGTWTSYMTTKVKSTKPSHMFLACSKIFKHDVKTALFLLPHVLLYVLLDGSQEDAEEAYVEIMAVLTHIQRNEDIPVPSSDFRQMSAQTVFSALDYLNRWTRARAHSLAVKTQLLSSRNRSGLSVTGSLDQYKAVETFLEKIPQDVLAYASFNCKAYARALMHFEAFISSQKQDVQQHLAFMQKLYIALDEPDGVAGVAASRKHQPTLHEQILDHKSSGKLCDASARYEKEIQEEPDEIGHRKGLLQCLIDLGQVRTALTHVNGVVTRRPEWEKSLNAYRVEASWRLGQWDSLESYLKVERGVEHWDIGLGRILLAAKEKNEKEFGRQLRIVRSQQMGFLSAASMESGSYQRGYEHIVRLHMLRELEEAVKRRFRVASDGEEAEGLAETWESRLHISQTSFRTREQILNLRRVVLKLLPSSVELQKEQGKSWLQSAKAARVAGHVQTADISLLSASDFSLPNLCIERAKWMASQGEVHRALITLQRAVSEQWPDDEKNVSNSGNRFIHAKALLLVGRWMEETAHYEPNRIIQQYKEVTALHNNWENGHFYLGKYYDKLMVNCADGDEKSNKLSVDFIRFVLRHYGQSLQFGNKYIYQSMPRLLTIWLDFGATVPDQGRQTKSSDKVGKRQRLADFNEIVAELTKKLPPYQFLTAFSLLISRICHTNKTVFEQLEKILAKLLITYPQQAMWMMMAVSKSSFAMRKTRCVRIFSQAISRDAKLKKFLEDSTKLTDRLLEVCNKEVSKGASKDKLSISHDFSVLKRLVSDSGFSDIVVPLQSAMTVTLPSGAGSHLDHNPFPGTLACIAGFEDAVDVLQSLQKPKKITIRGSDGNCYTMMCKPKDDLRKDSRTMEFNALVNKCLRKDPESRSRQLHIRTYAVIPLNEECGLLEWVQNTHGLRNILTKIYKEKNMYMRGADIKKLIDKAENKLEDKIRVFEKDILPRHPSVFHEWFLKRFPNPTSWYMSRLSYCRTSAVMCMVGYILGLGDRHGENILFDATCGDCVHVDFNCLFKKGETFDCPERVPFRLTHNLVDAMGPLGCEGHFRRSCEVTLRLLRNQCDSLLTVLRTFIYDPLVEWQRTKGRESLTEASKTGEVTNEEGVKILKEIERRFKGFEGNNRIMIPLSIEGQVHYLINEATNVENLSRMYIGWGPYL